MTWFLKATVFCATSLLLGVTFGVLGNTLWNCQQECKDQPDEHTCSRWNFTSSSGQSKPVSVYKWLRNECERKCVGGGKYQRVADMELCTKHNQTRMTYICSQYWTPKEHEKCMRNETMKN